MPPCFDSLKIVVAPSVLAFLKLLLPSIAEAALFLSKPFVNHLELYLPFISISHSPFSIACSLEPFTVFPIYSFPPSLSFHYPCI